MGSSIKLILQPAHRWGAIALAKDESEIEGVAVLPEKPTENMVDHCGVAEYGLCVTQTSRVSSRTLSEVEWGRVGFPSAR